MIDGLQLGTGVSAGCRMEHRDSQGSPSALKPKTSGSKELDPTGRSQNEPGAKLDAGKPDASLLLMFGRALEAVAVVGTFGARKYTRGGWQQVPDGINRYTAAMLRHVLKENHEPRDLDSGLLHAAHATWNALARLELMLREGDHAEE